MVLTAALETPSSRGGRGGARRMEPRYFGLMGFTTGCSVALGEPVCVCVCVCVCVMQYALCVGV